MRCYKNEKKIEFIPVNSLKANRVWGKQWSLIEQPILETNAGKTVLSCHRCLINTGVEKNVLYFNVN
jgi:hypothetical protein